MTRQAKKSTSTISGPINKLNSSLRLPILLQPSISHVANQKHPDDNADGRQDNEILHWGPALPRFMPPRLHTKRVPRHHHVVGKPAAALGAAELEILFASPPHR
jgi:hypothetical protein